MLADLRHERDQIGEAIVALEPLNRDQRLSEGNVFAHSPLLGKPILARLLSRELP